MDYLVQDRRHAGRLRLRRRHLTPPLLTLPQKVSGAKVIGVDVDQAGCHRHGYSGVEDMTVTSAMKGLDSPPSRHMLTETILNGNWDKLRRQGRELSASSPATTPEPNYVQIPMDQHAVGATASSPRPTTRRL